MAPAALRAALLGWAGPGQSLLLQWASGMDSAELRGEQRVGKAGAGRCLQMVKRALLLEGIRRQSRATGLGPSTRKSSQGGENKAVGEKQRTDIGTCVHRVFHESFLILLAPSSL